MYYAVLIHALDREVSFSSRWRVGGSLIRLVRRRRLYSLVFWTLFMQLRQFLGLKDLALDQKEGVRVLHLL